METATEDLTCSTPGGVGGRPPVGRVAASIPIVSPGDFFLPHLSMLPNHWIQGARSGTSYMS